MYRKGEHVVRAGRDFRLRPQALCIREYSSDGDRMKLSTDTRYAVRILFELTDATRPMSISALSRKTGMTFRAVENVHTVLRQQGVTEASVGAKGGIVLIRPISEISLGQLIAWFDDGVEFSVCCGDKGNECPQQNDCMTRSTWRAVSDRVQDTLNEVWLADVRRRFTEPD